MTQFIYIYDSRRCKALTECWFQDTSDWKAVMATEMANLEQKILGRSPRFHRLAYRLHQHFPIAEHQGLWLGRDPQALVQNLEAGVWKLEIAEPALDEFLKVLLPLARQLYFTLYVPARDLLVGYDTSSGEYLFPASAEVRARLDPGALTGQFLRGKLRTRLVEKLKLLLGELGFTYGVLNQGGFQFRRRIEGGDQLIYGWIGTHSTGFRCTLFLEVLSERYYEIWKQIYPENDASYDKAATVLSETSKDLREVRNPGWSWTNGDSYAIDKCRSHEELDWLVDDFIQFGLPILEKARTIEGLRWLYCHPDAKVWLSGNLHNQSMAPAYVVYAARQADDATFSEIARCVLEKGKGTAWAASMERYISYFRDKVEPFGTGPA